MLVKANETYTICQLVTYGGFVDETTTESSYGSDVHLLESTHEEADTHIILHATAACEAGFERIIIASIDPDVLVRVIHFAAQMSRELWMRTATAKQRRFIAVADIRLPPTLRRNIPAYHAITGCDSRSYQRTTSPTADGRGPLTTGILRYCVLQMQKLCSC